jgi:hypothetical protein
LTAKRPDRKPSREAGQSCPPATGKATVARYHRAMIPALLLSLAVFDVDEPLPPRAVARLAPQRFHLGGPGFGMTVSPDGCRACFAVRGEIGVWNTTTGRRERTYPGRQPLAYSPDSQSLAVLGPLDGGPTSILLVDTASGRVTGRLPGDSSRVEFAAFAGARALVNGADDLTLPPRGGVDRVAGTGPGCRRVASIGTREVPLARSPRTDRGVAGRVPRRGATRPAGGRGIGGGRHNEARALLDE